jgi:hypothetical protein
LCSAKKAAQWDGKFVCESTLLETFVFEFFDLPPLILRFIVAISTFLGSKCPKIGRIARLSKARIIFVTTDPKESKN